MIGSDSFRTLEDIEVITNPNHPSEPWFATGGLAIVFKVKYQNKLYALKCFTKEVPERQERLYEISKYLKQNPSEYFVDFNYYENEIWVDNEEGGQGYPIVLMEWVEGLTLDNYLKDRCAIEDKLALKRLYDNFCEMALWLNTQPISHGDLKHDNIIVLQNGKIKLIDYDGMFIPQFDGLKAYELGSPCYQHPMRSFDHFNEDLDDFSLLILQNTLLLLEVAPPLFSKYFNGDGILFDGRNFLVDFNSLHYIDNRRLKIMHIEIEKMMLNSNILVTKKRKFIYNDNPISFICREKTYSLSKRDYWFEKYYSFLDWDAISKNTHINWSLEILEKYEDKLSWSLLSSNSKIKWTKEALLKFESKLNWLSLSEYGKFDWDIDLIETFENKWSWNKLVSYNQIVFTEQIIEKYKSEINWDKLCGFAKIQLTPEFLENETYQWNWNNLSRNENLNWNTELIEKFKDRLYWPSLSMNNSLPWTLSFIEQFESMWDFHRLSDNNSIPWSIDLIEKYSDRWNWGSYDERYLFDLNQKTPIYRGLSALKSINWNLEIYYRFKKNWWDQVLLANKSFLNSKELNLIVHHEYMPQNADLNDENGFFFRMYVPFEVTGYWQDIILHNETVKFEIYSQLTNIPWSIDLLKNTNYKWNWSILSKNTSLPWSFSLIKTFEDKWDWEYLSQNLGIPWSFEIIFTFRENWLWYSLSENVRFLNFFEENFNFEVIDLIFSMKKHLQK